MRRIWASSEIPPTMRGYSLASFVLRSGKQQLVDDVRAVWAESDRWLLLTGSVGLGKTGLAVSLLLVLWWERHFFARKAAQHALGKREH